MKKPYILPRKIWKYNGKSNFQLFFCWSKRPNFFLYNRNMDLLISKMLWKLNFWLREVVKLKICKYAQILICAYLQFDHFLKFKIYFGSCFEMWRSIFLFSNLIVLTPKKSLKLDFPLYFQILRKRVQVFFFFHSRAIILILTSPIYQNRLEGRLVTSVWENQRLATEARHIDVSVWLPVEKSFKKIGC